MFKLLLGDNNKYFPGKRLTNVHVGVTDVIPQ